MKIHSRFGEKSKLPAKLNIGDVIPFASSVNGADLMKSLREKGYECKQDSYTKYKIKAFGFIVITNAI